MARMPIIGLTTYAERASWGSFSDVPVALIQDAYHGLVARAGARPILIPQVAEQPVAGVAELLDVIDGLENAPGALIGLLEGRNRGKCAVRVA